MPHECAVLQALRAKIGSVVKVRVLDVNLGKRRCSLTLKRTLLETSLPLITSYEEAAAGAPRLISHGVVTSIQPGLGLIVTFYGNVRGLVGEKELKLAVLFSLLLLFSRL